MKKVEIPRREEIALEHTWNAESIFASEEAWQTEFAVTRAALPEVKAFEGRLHEGAAVLLAALKTSEKLWLRTLKLYLYASMAHSVETSNQAAAALLSKAQGLYGQMLASAAFIEPELIGLGPPTLMPWLDAEPDLAIYRHYLENLFRQQAHVRSGEVEEILGMLADPFSGVENNEAMLTDADFKFAPAVSSDGRELPVTQSSLHDILVSPDRAARRTAWENYSDTYLAFKNTLASNLNTSVKQNVFMTRVRRHESSLAASLFNYNIPESVFHNLIDVYRRNLPTWHRYWRVRRQALGVDQLNPYDIWAPLTGESRPVNYRQAVDWICEGMEPLGDEYVLAMRQGCLTDRWVDIYPNQGKRAGAFSSGVSGTHPFIVMSYTDDINSLSTLAHELGHSMHSYFTWQTQPLIYSHYSLFVAEVASNFNQALVRAHLLATNPDPGFQIAVIEEAMSNFHRYFFIMPTLARFELEVHQRVERGEGVTADAMIALMTDLFREGYGDEMNIDHDRVGITWAQFGHLYADYYVYQYATGISAAHALSRPILKGEPGAADRYMDFLRAGGSVYPLDALKLAGVDMTTAQPVEATYAILADMVAKLEQLLG
jgi:oligoendopeptidase F